MAENVNLGLEVKEGNDGTNSTTTQTTITPDDTDSFLAGAWSIYIPIIALIVILIELLIIIKQRRKIKSQAAQILSNNIN